MYKNNDHTWSAFLREKNFFVGDLVINNSFPGPPLSLHREVSWPPAVASLGQIWGLTQRSSVSSGCFRGTT